jgi:hypothetical protein
MSISCTVGVLKVEPTTLTIALACLPKLTEGGTHISSNQVEITGLDIEKVGATS